MDKNKFKDILQKARVQFNGCLDNLRDGGKTVVITILLAFVIMTASCLAVFFYGGSGRGKSSCARCYRKKPYRRAFGASGEGALSKNSS